MGWSFLRVVSSLTRNFMVIAFTYANMYATSMTQRIWNDGSGPKGLTLHLPVLS